MMRLAIALIGAAASAPSAAVGAPPPAGEWIAQAPLAGFVVGHRLERGGNLIEERIPTGENVNGWTRMVTVQRFAGVARRITAPAYLENLRTNLLPQDCPGAISSAVRAVAVSGHRAARVRADCPRNPATGLPETFLIVAIEGASDLHVAQVAFRRVPSAPDIAWAERQLGSVVLCTSASRDAACRAR